MAEKKNALAGIADYMNWAISCGRLTIELPSNFQYNRQYLFDSFTKAQRIVAVLAGVKWHDSPNTKVGALPDSDSLIQAIVECRAIAEEGDSDALN